MCNFLFVHKREENHSTKRTNVCARLYVWWIMQIIVILESFRNPNPSEKVRLQQHLRDEGCSNAWMQPNRLYPLQRFTRELTRQYWMPFHCWYLWIWLTTAIMEHSFCNKLHLFLSNSCSLAVPLERWTLYGPIMRSEIPENYTRWMHWMTFFCYDCHHVPLPTHVQQLLVISWLRSGDYVLFIKYWLIVSIYQHYTWYPMEWFS